MNSRRRGRPRAWSWGWFPLGAVVYAAIALVILTLDLEPIRGTVVHVPPWAIIVTPLLVYAVLALGVLGRLSTARAVVGFSGLATLHTLLVAGTGGFISLVEAVDFVQGLQMVVRDLPTLAVAQLVVVPPMLAPLWRLLMAPPRATRPARPSSTPRAAPPAASPAPAPPVTPDSPPARPVAPARTVSPPAAPAPAVPAPAAEAPPRETPRVETPAVPAVPARADRRAQIAVAPARAESAASEAIRAPMDEVVSIPFARIAGQLPADAFRLPLDRVAVSLREPGLVLVPRRLLTPQLAEGAAHVKWDVVAEQFPREALAITTAELVQRLPDGRLDLPLDEIIAQMPPGLFALSSTAVDVRGIEEFPPPFQPHGLPPSPPVAEPEPPEREPAAAREPARAFEPAPAPVSASAATAPGAPAARLAALLAPSLGMLAVDTVTVSGTTLVVAAAASRARADVVDAASRALPFLADARLPAPAEQLTVRSEDAALVLTPLGGDTALATVPASNASLALLERLALRAAVEAGRNGGERPATGPGADELRDVDVPEHVRALAGSLHAFGPVTPSLLRDADGTLVYLFLPAEMDARPLGAFARALARALDGSALGGMSAATVRFGTQCLVIQVVAGSVARTTLLVTGGGPVARPGLARLELERAGLRLGTL
jgi:virulence-associated protein VagC